MDSSRKPKGKKRSKRGQSCRKIEDLSDAPMPSSMPQPTVKIENKMLLRAALKSAADSGTFIDTKFYAFSRRDPSRTAYEPKAVYANGWLLRARLPSYFEPRKPLSFSECIFHKLPNLSSASWLLQSKRCRLS